MTDEERKTDETTVNLDTVLGVTKTTVAEEPPSASGELDPSPPVEANIILISHPDDVLLGTRYRLPPHGKLEIGRSSDADVSMPAVQSLSRNHARINHLGDLVEIEDLGSTNGTFVNDYRVVDRQPLRSGDRFQLGSAHFKFLHEQDPEHAYHEAIYQLVVSDGLTQTYNKRKFDEELEREFARAVRHQRPLTLILFDVDHFKAVNDDHGHLCGDYVLQQIARRTTEHLRPEQVFARVGGEEFVILSPEIEMAGALELAEKLRLRFRSESFCYAGAEVEITCSFGVASLERDMRRPVDLYSAADHAMYAAKRAGRDQVSRHRPSGGDR